MKGRDLLSLLEPLLKVFIFITRLFPQFILRIVYDLSRFIPWRLGIFIRLILIRTLSKSGNNIYIATNVTIKNPEYMVLGDNVSIHENCFIDANGGLEIGNNVSIAHNSSIVCFEHSWADITTPIKYNPLVLKKITIGDDVWIGCGVRILAGASLSNRTVVAAGSIVNKAFEGNVLIAGVPSKVKKALN
ncbi:acyltransferase [Vibrio algivorus]|uniref:Acyltransferase n=1 Tax=Vibrio algivorus TaxID=1667024 RepID=A0ABQ6EJ86_9VIBR|nr:acyltransferase [Vibrio algivorus]GLT13178.1 hypothetical protein GCM10007931_01520 [Vibrio algivorus]